MKIRPPKDLAEASGWFARRQMIKATVTGADAPPFLQGLATQNVRFAADPAKSRFLFPKSNGKIIFEAYVEKIENGFALYLHPDSGEIAAKYFDFFLIREAVEIGMPSGEVSLNFAFGTGTVPRPLYSSPNGNFSVTAEEPGQDFAEIEGESGLLSLKAAFGLAEVLDRPESYPAELSLLECVSWDKGCYVGQEPIARMRFKGKARKSVYRVRSETKLGKGEKLKTEKLSAGEVLLASEIPRSGKFHSLALLKNATAESENPNLKAGEINVQIEE